ncbi:MAG TPA: hypothetical protein VI298_10310 [Geobacteraceae bacterium]
MDCQAIALANDLVKEVLTLSTGLLAFTATFRKDVKDNGSVSVAILIVAWIILLVSVVYGILSLMTIVGIVVPATDPGKPCPVLTSVTGPFKVQIVSFGLGAILMVVYAGLVLLRRDKKRGDL